MDFYSTPVERNEGAKISANFLAFRRACLQDPIRAHRTAEAIVSRAVADPGGRQKTLPAARRSRGNLAVPRRFQGVFGQSRGATMS